MKNKSLIFSGMLVTVGLAVSVSWAMGAIEEVLVEPVAPMVEFSVETEILSLAPAVESEPEPVKEITPPEPEVASELKAVVEVEPEAVPYQQPKSKARSSYAS